MQRSNPQRAVWLKQIGFVLGKSIVTIGALFAGALVGIFIYNLNEAFYLLAKALLKGVDQGVNPDFWTPSFLDGPPVIQVSALLAVLIPISLAVWWRQPTDGLRHIKACSCGIAAGLGSTIPEILVSPFMLYEGQYAISMVTLLATVVLSTEVTRHLIRADTSGSPIVPRHVRKGLTRAYAVIAIPWVIWFGYSAYNEYASYNSMTSQIRKLFKLEERLEDPTISQGQRENIRETLAKMATDWDVKNQDDVADRMLDYRDENIGNRFTMAIYAVLAALIPPLLYPIFIWVLAGFRKPASTKAA
jgi:hypothetical protein